MKAKFVVSMSDVNCGQMSNGRLGINIVELLMREGGVRLLLKGSREIAQGEQLDVLKNGQRRLNSSGMKISMTETGVSVNFALLMFL